MKKKATFTNRICKDCGGEFTPNGANQTYCKRCAEERARNRKKIWHEKNYIRKPPRESVASPCCVCGGEFLANIDGKPYCSRHYHRMHTYGVAEFEPKNKYENVGECVEITVKGDRKIWIDASDVDVVSEYIWCYSKTGYPVARNKDGKIVRLNRLLMEPEQGLVVDHIDGNPANNRRSNLRICTAKDNARNARTLVKNKYGCSGIKETKKGRFLARIVVDRKEIRLGIFETLEEAISARQSAEIKYYGEFAPCLREKT